MDENARRLIEQGDKLFQKRTQLLSLWQEIALNFYVERADFTVTRNLGDSFADHLMNSYPLLARRDLGNSFGSMLRRDDWFQIDIKGEADAEGKQWLQWATRVQYKAMYDRVAQFNRATKEGDHDFAAFGQCAITVDLSRDRSSLLYRNWHLRDIAWCEGVDGAIDVVHHKWKPTARDLIKLFGKKVHSKVHEIAQKDPYAEINCRRIVMQAEDYPDYKQVSSKLMMPIVSIYLDADNGHLLEVVGLRLNPYVIPRWQTVSGSQYAYSPATVAALPDARLIQAMTLVLLDAGEKSADPPMLAVGDAIRSEIDVRAGGVTWVDAEYDRDLQNVLRPLSVDRHGIPPGIHMAEETRAMIAEAFYLNKLSLPMQAGDMTATEVSQRVQEYIRNALPLFEPMEKEYNAALCETTFQVMLNNGAFGAEIPESLQGQDVEFKFESPLRAAADRERGSLLAESMGLIQAVAPVDPSVAANLDANQALRDALEGIGVPARWIRTEADAAEMAGEIQAELQAQKMMAMGAEASKMMPAA